MENHMTCKCRKKANFLSIYSGYKFASLQECSMKQIAAIGKTH